MRILFTLAPFFSDPCAQSFEAAGSLAQWLWEWRHHNSARCTSFTSILKYCIFISLWQCQCTPNHHVGSNHTVPKTHTLPRGWRMPLFFASRAFCISCEGTIVSGSLEAIWNNLVVRRSWNASRLFNHYQQQLQTTRICFGELNVTYDLTWRLLHKSEAILSRPLLHICWICLESRRSLFNNTMFITLQNTTY